MSGSHKLVSLLPGKSVFYAERNYRITKVLSLTQVELLDDESHQKITANIEELTPPIIAGATEQPDILAIDDEAWQLAKSRLEIIKPLLDINGRTRQQVAELALQHSLHINTLYLWLRAYESSGLLSSLLPKSRKDKGMLKLDDTVEEIIKEAIATEYLSKQKKSQQKVCNKVRQRCLELKLAVPHDNTIRNRIKVLSGEKVAAARLGRKTADLDYKPHEGKFPGADYPLAVVQIDHTKLDIILVDDHYRQPIGRPWITLAFDVCSRMVTGFYVSFDPPSALSTGLCLVHAILPKEKWLLGHEVKSEWPLWGLPAKIHLDNAKEFRGNMLQRACDEYGIDIEWRPVGRPNFGAHVERALGSFAQEIHTLPGTTFSNPRQKGEYDSEGKASLTLTEFETWLTTYIVDVYHQKRHSSIGMSPMMAFQRGIFGNEQQPGSGLPARIADEYRLRLDFMPFELRTVQDYGVVIDEIHYYHDILRPWINAPDPKEPRRKRKFMFRRDPRDISQIWFYDPELNNYFPVPYRDTSHPPVSIWELREARSRAEADGRKEINEHAIFEAYERMREIEQQAIDKSKAARRAVQRRKRHHIAHQPLTESLPEQTLSSVWDADEPDIQPFDEMDEF